MLRESARGAMGLMDGDYFDSSVFEAQAEAVLENIKEVLTNSEGDAEFLVWHLSKND